jgi:hypothetical protein
VTAVLQLKVPCLRILIEPIRSRSDGVPISVQSAEPVRLGCNRNQTAAGSMGRRV